MQVVSRDVLVSSKPDKSNLVLSGSATISWLFGASGPCSSDLWLRISKHLEGMWGKLCFTWLLCISAVVFQVFWGRAGVDTLQSMTTACLCVIRDRGKCQCVLVVMKIHFWVCKLVSDLWEIQPLLKYWMFSWKNLRLKLKHFIWPLWPTRVTFFSRQNVNVNCEHIYPIDVYWISELFALTDLISRGQLCK